MSFLNKKKRIIDTYLTPLGRKNLSTGNLNIQYVAVTDINSLYVTGSKNVLDETFSSLIIESRGNQEDNMFFTSDNYDDFNKSSIGNIGYITGDYLVSGDGKITYTTGSYILTGEEFVSAVSGITTGSYDRLKNKNFLKNKPGDFEKEEFKDFIIDKDRMTFYISSDNPIASSALKEISIDTAEPFFFDKFVSNTDKYKFLPPVYMSGNFGINENKLGNYEDLNQKDVKNFEDVKEIIGNSRYQELKFTKTSRDSNIVCQIFGINQKETEPKIVKLDTIDFGEFYDEGKFKKVIFAGRVFRDNYNYPTYINIFTIIMEE